MRVLIAGAGVIGTVYGTQLAKRGHSVDVLAHGLRTEQIQRTGLLTTDAISGVNDDVSVSVVSGASEEVYDLVLVSVKVDQIDSVCADLRRLSGAPEFLFFGNNPAGRRGLPHDLPGSIYLGFPGVGGDLDRGDRVAYMRIPGQPTTLEKEGGAYLEEFSTTLKASGFPVTRTSDIDGWLAYHGVFIGAVSSALYRCGCSATALAANRDLLTLMCRSIEEGFRALKRAGIRGLPRNLRILHQPKLRRFAVWYWARAMKSPVGEHCFAAHCRHAEPEMESLAQDTLRRFKGTERTENLRLLLSRGEVAPTTYRQSEDGLRRQL
jgi:ketopantoate reductase